MGATATHAAEFFAATGAISAIAVVMFSRVAPLIGIMDVPGGRKQHAGAVPLVGGISIFVALLAGAVMVGIAPRAGYFLLALSIIIAVGMWDDVAEISPRIRFVIQIIASTLMIWGANVQLSSLGDLFGYRPLGLWILGVPLTIFAIVGVVNSVNMMDGMDGLAGCTALTAFAWYALVANDAGLDVQFHMALLLCGGIAGFLLFNLRFPWQPRARVFLGDAGSLMIGFALGWFAIDLTQGEGRTFPPVAALWIIVLPLVDCVSLMARRVRMGKSPFDGDRHHIHHYFLARGFTPSQTLAILTGLSVFFGAVGYFGWRLHVPEPVLFWGFLASFILYHRWIDNAWKRVEASRVLDASRAPGVEPAVAPLLADEQEEAISAS
jgi:UDP-GlcNAc:undecaprenyl-phosphate/decaprenyl-phosphate GlcNAc-1-phosphate transferase